MRTKEKSNKCNRKCNQNYKYTNNMKMTEGGSNTAFLAKKLKDAEPEGYNGDSFAAAAEYKRKYEEEQKHMQQQKQNPTDQNWILPVSKGHRITSNYGYRLHPIYHTRKFHDGIDINARANTPVYAVAGGTVVKAKVYGGYGNYIEINHGNNIHSFYGHLNKIYVKQDKPVKQGQVIGLSGNTGVGTNAHLHFGVHKNNKKDNPLKYLPKF